MGIDKKFLLKELYNDLISSEPNRQQYAIENYHKHAQLDDYKQLLDLFDHPKWKVREAAYQILRRQGSKIIPFLEPLLEKENENYVYWSIKILGEIYPDGFRTIKEKFNYLSLPMKKAALNSLTVINKKEIIAFLIECLTSDSWSLRKTAYDILAQVNSPFLFPIIEKNFFKELKSGNENFCYWAIKILSRKFSQEGIKSLVKAYQKGNDRLRYFIVVALGESKREEAIEFLINAFADKVWIIRRQAALEILKFGRATLPYLTRSFLRKNGDIRFWAAWVLSRLLKKKEILKEFSKILQIEDEDLQFFAMDVIGNTRDEEAFSILFPYLSSPTWFLRKQAAENIIKLGDRVITKLLPYLKSQNEDLAFWSVKIISHLGKSGISVLKDYLFSRDVSQNLKKFILTVFSDLEEDVEINEIIIMVLNDPSWPIRNLAYKILVNRKSKEVLTTAIIIAGIDKENSELNFWVGRLFQAFLPNSKKLLFNLIKKEIPEAFIFIYRNLDLLEHDDFFILKNYLDSDNSMVRELTSKIFQKNIVILRPFYSMILEKFSLRGIETVVSLLMKVEKDTFEREFLYSILKEEERFLPSLKEKVLLKLLEEKVDEEKPGFLLDLIYQYFDYRLKDVYFDFIFRWKEVFKSNKKLKEKLKLVGKKFPPEYQARLMEEFEEISYDIPSQKTEDAHELISNWEAGENLDKLLDVFLQGTLEDQFKYLDILRKNISYQNADAILMFFLDKKKDFKKEIFEEFVSLFLTYDYYKTISFALEILKDSFSPFERINFLEKQIYPEKEEYYAKLLRIAFDRKEDDDIGELVSRIFTHTTDIKSVISVFIKGILHDDVNYQKFCFFLLQIITAPWIDKFFKMVLTKELSIPAEKEDEIFTYMLDLIIKRGKFSYPDAVIGFLNHKEPNLVVKALEIISFTGDEVYLNLILDAYQSPSWIVRKKVLVLIGNMLDKFKEKITPVLLKAVVDENSLLRSQARELILKNGDRELIAAVILTHFVRQKDVELIEELKSFINASVPFSLEVLVPYLLDSNLEFRALVKDIFAFHREESVKVLLKKADLEKAIEFNEICKILSEHKEITLKLLKDVDDEEKKEKIKERIR